MMWLNWSVATINATLQLLDIYRLVFNSAVISKYGLGYFGMSIIEAEIEIHDRRTSFVILPSTLKSYYSIQHT